MKLSSIINISQNELNGVAGGDCFCSVNMQIYASKFLDVSIDECKNWCCNVHSNGSDDEEYGIGNSFDEAKNRLYKCKELKFNQALLLSSKNDQFGF